MRDERLVEQDSGAGVMSAETENDTGALRSDAGGTGTPNSVADRPRPDADVLIARLARYVATPSVSRQEAPLADLVARELEAAGLRVQRCDNNVWCELGDAPRPRLLLNSHLDTVPPGQGWSHDPWQPQIKEKGDIPKFADAGLSDLAQQGPKLGMSPLSRIIGLGANDAKGCVVALVEATLSLKRRIEAGGPLGGTVVLALTAEEEISGNGLGTILSRLRPIDAAIVGEPTALVPMIAQRGLLILRCAARGRTAHPANTSAAAANNAISHAATAISRLASFDWGPVHPVLGPCHGHVTKIAGGVALNVIPDLCEFWIDVRTTPAETHAALTERLRRFLNAAQEAAGPAGGRGHGEIELHVHSDRLVPVETPESAPIVQAALRALTDCGIGFKPVPHTIAPAGSPAMSDMVFLAGTPAVKIGPGESPRSHTPDEYISVDELVAGAAAYERIAREYFALGHGAKKEAAVRASGAAQP